MSSRPQALRSRCVALAPPSAVGVPRPIHGEFGVCRGCDNSRHKRPDCSKALTRLGRQADDGDDDDEDADPIPSPLGEGWKDMPSVDAE